MQRVMTTLLVLTIGLMAMFGGQLVSYAQAAEVSGTGTVTASGSGTAQINGSGTVQVGPGAGIIWVRGDADIQMDGRGRRTTLPDGTVRITGWPGTVTVSGSDIQVRVVGEAIELQANGTGTVRLFGVGTYTVGDVTGEWQEAGVSVNF
ncbi:MAG: hypothetical protein HC911_02745 [Chloroflexaceae bacterium]|nr:hypothetical protein [Chloroflexaceae bacterium]